MVKSKEEAYWELVNQRAKEIGSDGCTGVADIYKKCCYEHDIHYRTGKDLWGNPLTRGEADKLMRQCVQKTSLLGRLSPVSWVRWAGVRIFGGRAWKGNKNGE